MLVAGDRRYDEAQRLNGAIARGQSHQPRAKVLKVL